MQNPEEVKETPFAIDPASVEPSKNFLEDYLLYNKGNECPEGYHVWTALAVLSATVNRKVWLNMGYFEIIPNLFACLVGEQGNRKTAAKDIGYDMLREVCPNIPVSAESMSKEAITKFMAEDEQSRSFKDPKSGMLIETHPFAIFITELKNFLSINPTTMVDFLTTIYDRKFYDVKTKGKGTDIIPNPCVVFLACETPEWLVARLKDSIISGGFCRRMMFIVEEDSKERIAFPTITKESALAAVRCKKRLAILNKDDFAGEFQWTPESKKFYEDWYVGLVLPSDTFMRGFYRSKHVQVLKAAMLVSIAQRDDLILTIEDLKIAIALVNRVEENLPKLTNSVGRNELALHTSRLLDIIKANGGAMFEKQLQRVVYKDFDISDFIKTINHLVSTDQLKRGKLGERYILGFPEQFDQLKSELEKRLKTSDPSAQPSSAPAGQSSWDSLLKVDLSSTHVQPPTD